MTRLAKPDYYTGKEIVEDHKEEYGIEAFQLFDLMKSGIRVLTWDGRKVVDSDPLPRGVKYPKEHFEKIKQDLEDIDRGRYKAGKAVTGPIGNIRSAMSKPLNYDPEREFEKQPLIIIDPPDPSKFELISFSLRYDVIGRSLAISKALTFRYLVIDIDEYFFKKKIQISNVETIKADTAEPSKPPDAVIRQKESESTAEAVKPCSENSFKQNSGFWTIQYEGEAFQPIKHVEGLLYIALLLDQPKTPISCQKLYQSAAGPIQESVIPESQAIANNLSIGFSQQSLDHAKTREVCREEYDDLQERLATANLEDKEVIKDKMEKLQPYLNLKERYFADPNDKKAQSNVTKRLKTAYYLMDSANMKSLVEHLRSEIRSDGAYGLMYAGSTTWNIVFK